MLDLAQSGKDLQPTAAKPARNLKIGVSLWSFAPNTGGLQAHAELLCHYLLARGHDITVITRSATRVPRGSDYLFFNESAGPIYVDNVPVSPLRVSGKWKPLLWTILKLAARKNTRLLAARCYEVVLNQAGKNAFAGYDLIHHIGHATAFMGLVSARAAKFHGIPFLVQPTAHPFNFGDSEVDFRLYRQANRLLVHTRYEENFFRTKGITCPINVVGNGIEGRSDGRGERFKEKYAIHGPLILFIGRKAMDKGYPLVMEAFKLVRKIIPEAILVCIGPPVSQIKIERLPGVVDLDFVSEDEKHDALAACSCLCVPSEGESFGLVYMEAGRYRKPVIGRNLPVLKELLGGKAAMLLGKADDIKNTAKLSAKELAAGIVDLLNKPELGRQLGEECYKRSENFLWPNVINRFEESYYLSMESRISK